MAEPETSPSSQVALLVPHPTRTAVLVMDAPAPADVAPTPTRLPVLRLRGEDPLLPEILTAIDGLDVVVGGEALVLRQIVLPSAPGPDGEEVALLLELEPTSSDAPQGWAWLDVDAQTLARLEPARCRAALESWVDERQRGWSPRRPPWSRPGWFDRASAWMIRQMAASGRPAVGPPRQRHLWGVSVVLRAPAADGDAFLKGSAGVFRHEAVVTAALAERMPDLVPDVAAVEAEEGWMLMRDLGAGELGDQEESRWHQGLQALAAIQQRWLGRTDELVALGVPVRSLTELAGQVEVLADDAELFGRMEQEVQERWLAATSGLAEACRRLAELGPGFTLVHGDFHPWNVASGHAGDRVFDWTDAAISHPAVDLATYVFRTPDLAVRRGMVEAWVAAWSPGADEQEVREAADLGLVVGAFYQVQTYRSLLPTLAADGADDGLAGDDVDWISRTLDRHERGLESER